MDDRAPRRGAHRLGRGAGRVPGRRADRGHDGAPGRLNASANALARRVGLAAQAALAALAALAVLAVLAVLAALGGCAAPGASAPDGPSEAAVAAAAVELDARRAALDAFAVGGALGYWTDDENVTARLDWREAGGTTEIFLAGPLGLGALTLVDGPGGATLARSGAPPVSGPSADALLQGVLGLEAPIPLAAARDWLRGLPGPGATDVRRDAAGRLETLLWSDGAGARWFARIRRWTEVDGAAGAGAADADRLELPALVTARSGDRRLRLALSDWRLGVPGAPAATGPDGPGNGDGGAPGTGGRLVIPGR